jgi:hypothetical protein
LNHTDITHNRTSRPGDWHCCFVGYPGRPRFKSQPENRLFWCSWFASVPLGKCLDSFSHTTAIYSGTTEQRNIQYYVDCPGNFNFFVWCHCCHLTARWLANTCVVIILKYRNRCRLGGACSEIVNGSPPWRVHCCRACRYFYMKKPRLNQDSCWQLLCLYSCTCTVGLVIKLKMPL